MLLLGIANLLKCQTYFRLLSATGKLSDNITLTRSILQVIRIEMSDYYVSSVIFNILRILYFFLAYNHFDKVLSECETR